MIEHHSTYALIANGKIDDYNAVSQLIQQHACIIAVDGGLLHCDQMGISPHLIIGDMDSVDQTLLRCYTEVPSIHFPREKNETDLELALQSVYHPEVEKITIFGALEKRTDHVLGNLHLLRRYPLKVIIENESEKVFAINSSTTIPCSPGQTISFIPIGNSAAGISTKGLKWELKDATFNHYFFSLSNICLKDSIQLTISAGDLICCLQKLENNTYL